MPWQANVHAGSGRHCDWGVGLQPQRRVFRISPVRQGGLAAAPQRPVGCQGSQHVESQGH
ncbi:MAG TPA: hypothetical protein VI749_05510 [Candidatus Omnitrophota bacterium]|nr:hypothetical protein [Candidatus Omnitrophota bacterium]